MLKECQKGDNLQYMELHGNLDTNGPQSWDNVNRA